MNIGTLGLNNIHVFASDVLSTVRGKEYDLILSNPPFHTGRDVDYRVAMAFIEQSYEALTSGGQLYVVANRFIRYDKIIDMYFQHVDQVLQSPRFHVLCGVK
jgi:16S rRNA (guanine1207-N2)-methyltransferase